MEAIIAEAYNEIIKGRDLNDFDPYTLFCVQLQFYREKKWDWFKKIAEFAGRRINGTAKNY